MVIAMLDCASPTIRAESVEENEIPCPRPNFWTVFFEDDTGAETLNSDFGVSIVYRGLGWAEHHPRPEACIMLLSWAEHHPWPEAGHTEPRLGWVIVIVIVGWAGLSATHGQRLATPNLGWARLS